MLTRVSATEHNAKREDPVTVSSTSHAFATSEARRPLDIRKRLSDGLRFRIGDNETKTSTVVGIPLSPPKAAQHS